MDKNVEKDVKILLDSLENRLKSYFEELIRHDLDANQKHTKMQLDAVLNTVELIQKGMKMIETQINYKLGNIEGRVKKQNKEEYVADDLDLEVAIELANKIREKQGLEPLAFVANPKKDEKTNSEGTE